MAYDKLIVTVTLVGSLLSFVATTCVLISYIVYREQQQFINSLNNSISGIINVRDHALSPSPACTLNGWIGQLSVQAADFSILAIALVTVLTITRKTYMPDASLGRKVMICTSVWIVPLITSSTAAGLHTMAPVSGNWCWITSQRTDLRYALGHGWRFAIMFITIGVYIYVWWYMRQHFQKMAGTHEAKGSIDLNATYRTNRPRAASFATFRSSNDLAKEMSMERKDSASTYDEELQLEYARMPKKNHLVAVVVDSARNNFPASGRPRATQFPGSGGAINAKFTFNVREDQEEEEEEELVAPRDAHLPRHPSPIHTTTRTPSTTSTTHHPLLPTTTTPPPSQKVPPPSPTISTFATHQSALIHREIQRMLLLNAYPTAWVLLWLPGIANRLLEATGHTSIKALAVLQSSSQYVGFANALTYGFNECLRERIWGDVTRGRVALGRGRGRWG